jgi:GR25 family glycosyltransferase involved in LPS biosynthesis
MKLEEAFDRVVVINLSFKTERRERLERHLEEVGIADPTKIKWERAVCGDFTPPPAWWGAGNGAWGCLMSHLRVGQDAVHDNVSSYCVLEDDVIFHPKAPEMLDCFMRELPRDWGQVYLGGQFLHREPERITPWVMRPYNVNRTHAFALSRNTISRYLQHIMHAPDYFEVRAYSSGGITVDQNCFHIDHQLGRAHERRDWNTYVPTWWLAGQEGGSSNIAAQASQQASEARPGIRGIQRNRTEYPDDPCQRPVWSQQQTGRRGSERHSVKRAQSHKGASERQKSFQKDGARCVYRFFPSLENARDIPRKTFLGGRRSCKNIRPKGALPRHNVACLHPLSCFIDREKAGGTLERVSVVSDHFAGCPF